VVGLTAMLVPASPAGAVTVDCQVDAPSTIPAEFPAARSYASILDNGGCEFIWDEVVDRLVDGQYTPPGTMRVHWFSSGPGEAPAGVAGVDVYLSWNHIQSIYDQHQQQDWGMAYHEFAHVAQLYPGGSGAGWVTEGLADWVRYDLDHPPVPDPDPTPNCTGATSRHYSQGYECGATFLGWVDDNYSDAEGHSVIPSLNWFYHGGSTAPPGSILQALTGRTLAQLWSECLTEACAGGTP
jgi:hypothetical protein